MNFEQCFYNSRFILTEGAILERLRSEYRVRLDDFVIHAGLIYDSPDIVAAIYRQYIDIARKSNFPIMITTTTRSVNYETVRQSKYSDRNLISDSCSFLNKIREEYTDFSDKIFVGGLLGCRGDAYQADDTLQTADAYVFHKVQVSEFMKERVDFLFAAIMPALNEVVGMAEAMAESGLPYIISFMVRKNGCLLDGTSISEAIRIIDESVNPKPLCYMANCIHPFNLRLALENEVNSNSPQLDRFVGIQANASSLSPEELDNCGILHQEDFDEMIIEIDYLIKMHGLKILGGCCGTNDVYLEKLAKKITQYDVASSI